MFYNYLQHHAAVGIVVLAVVVAVLLVVAVVVTLAVVAVAVAAVVTVYMLVAAVAVTKYSSKSSFIFCSTKHLRSIRLNLVQLPISV